MTSLGVRKESVVEGREARRRRYPVVRRGGSALRRSTALLRPLRLVLMVHLMEGVVERRLLVLLRRQSEWLVLLRDVALRRERVERGVERRLMLRLLLWRTHRSFRVGGATGEYARRELAVL